MKKLLLFLILFPLLVSGHNYYISNGGDDNNDGLSMSHPWATISKINTEFSGFTAGDSILFKRGDVFSGKLIISKNGSAGQNIIVGAYGSGVNPVISGLETLSGWSSVSGVIYKTSANCKSSVNILTINGIPQHIGRYPNTGWLTYETFSTKVSITDNELSNSPNWTGAELVVRKNHWIIDRAPITNHTNTTITYTSSSNYNGAANYGYFIQKSLSTLDEFGEWYFDGTYMNVYFNTSPSAYVIKTSIYDTLVYANAKSYITFDNITFEGANIAALALHNCSNITIQNCSILYSGRDAVFADNGEHITIHNCYVNYVMNTVFDLDTYGGTGTNATITNNTIKNAGMFVGMDKGAGDGCNFGLSIQVPKSTIEYNTLDSCGYHGIIFVEDSTTVRNNYINNFCLVKDDGSGIYTYQQVATPVYYGRIVSDNIVLNGYGDGTGTSDGLSQANGIYMDGYTQNVTIDNNTVYNCHQAGLFLGWFSSNIIITDNKFYGSFYQLLIERHVATDANYTINRNQFISKDVGQNMIHYTATVADTPPWILGTWDSNYYIHPCGDDAVFVGDYYYDSKRYIKGFTYNQWKTYDVNAFPDISDISAYMYTLGTNLFSNSEFNSNVTGASLSYDGTAAFAWDNTTKINRGSLRLYYTTLSTNSNSTNVKFLLSDTLESSKDYLLTVSTLSASGEHMANVHLRQSVSPYAYLSPIQYIKIGETINNAEILFKAPTTGTAYIYVVVDDSTGTCYIDNVGLYEVNVIDKDIDDYIFFDYATNVSKTTTLPLHMVDLDGNPVEGEITIPSYSSVLYISDPNYRPSPIIMYNGKIVTYQGRILTN